MHNFPIDFAAAIAASEDRVRGLRDERMARPGGPGADPLPRLTQRILCEPLIVVVAGFLLGWLVFQQG